VNQKYLAKPIETFEFSAGGWRGAKVGVFQVNDGNETQIGEYERNYGSFFDTFFPFSRNGKDFALYSPDYTATRLMELPSCRDIGGEERNEGGFCPVDYFVPTFIDQVVIHYSNNRSLPTEQRSVNRINNPSGQARTEFTSRHNYTNGVTGQQCEDALSYRPLSPVTYYDFGFVAGCIWGDDSSWKIQYLDLSQAEKGIIRREEKFGYIVLPDGMRLKDAIDMYDYGYDQEDEVSHLIRIKSLQTFDLQTGQVIDPFG
jgi:hypothetical protein